MVPYNEPGDRAFWCISGKCLNPGCSPGRRPGARVQAGFYPAPSCPLLSVRLAGPRLIFVPPVHFSTIPVPQQLPFGVPTPRLTSGVVAATVMVVAGVSSSVSAAAASTRPGLRSTPNRITRCRAGPISSTTQSRPPRFLPTRRSPPMPTATTPSRRLRWPDAGQCYGSTPTGAPHRRSARRARLRRHPVVLEVPLRHQHRGPGLLARRTLITATPAPGPTRPTVATSPLPAGVERGPQVHVQQRAPPRQEYGKLSYAGG